MLLKYLKSCPLSIYVTSQIRGAPSRNEKQLMAFGSNNSVPLNCDATSPI